MDECRADRSMWYELPFVLRIYLAQEQVSGMPCVGDEQAQSLHKLPTHVARTGMYMWIMPQSR